MALEGKSEEELQQLEKQLLYVLRASDKKKGNVTLKQELGWPEDDYWAIRNRLIDAGLLVKGKGKGGSVTLIEEPVATEQTPEAPATAGQTPAPQAPAAAGRIEEDALYAPMAEVLKTYWVRDNRFREWVVEVTAKQGRRDTGGRWSRPDITIVSSTTLMFFPDKIFDVSTFEVKPAYGFDLTSVYEALAHRRAATRSYVLIHAPQAQQDTEECGELIDQICTDAKRHGIGVIIAADPTKYDTWDEKVEASRYDADPFLINEFLSAQLSAGGKEEISKWFR